MNYNHEKNIVSISILDRNYNIKCPPEQAEALANAAKEVDDYVRKIKESSGTTNTDRMLVVTALNFCHELAALKTEKSSLISNVEEKLANIQNRIQNSLAVEEEVTV